MLSLLVCLSSHLACLWAKSALLLTANCAGLPTKCDYFWWKDRNVSLLKEQRVLTFAKTEMFYFSKNKKCWLFKRLKFNLLKKNHATVTPSLQAWFMASGHQGAKLCWCADATFGVIYMWSILSVSWATEKLWYISSHQHVVSIKRLEIQKPKSKKLLTSTLLQLKFLLLHLPLWPS